MCKIQICKSSSVRLCTCFRKRPGCALIGACALIRTNTVHVVADESFLIFGRCLNNPCITITYKCGEIRVLNDGYG